MRKQSISSTNALKNKDTLPKDDLESLFYILIYFFNGSLPWYDPETKNKKYSVDEIISIREKIQPSYLCKNFPKEFPDYSKKYRNPRGYPRKILWRKSKIVKFRG